MAETLKSKLEASRKELLDLGMRNSLLNFKQLKSKGVRIVDELSDSIFRILVTQGKTMTFLPRIGTDEESEEIAPIAVADLEAPYNDTKLQTNESEKTLTYKLLNTFYAAKTSFEEQGVNILYLALGMLHWFEADNSQEGRLAPLVLIPVQLDRSNVRERVKLKYSLEEIGENVSLQAKMKAEFSIEIPVIGDIDDFDISAYLQKVADAVSGQPRWKVSPNEINLGFFSFNKFLIYTDLDNSKWPDGKKPIEHPLLQSLFEQGFKDNIPSLSDDAFIDTETNAAELFQVIDADSSQIHAMIASRGGKSLLIQGPPGTGKSQTITNLIADAVGQGKKVLFVAEKMAALDVVKRKLDIIGLDEICLELHSNKSNKKEFHAELIRVLNLGRPHTDRLQQDVNLLAKHKTELNEYCQAINALIPKGRLTVHQLIGHLLILDDLRKQEILSKIDKFILETWNADTFARAEAFAERIQARLQIIGVPGRLLFWGCRLSTLLPVDLDNLLLTFKALSESISAIKSTTNAICDILAIPKAEGRNEAESLFSSCEFAAQRPDLQGVQITSSRWLTNHAQIESLLDSTCRLQELYDQYEETFLPAAWSENILETRRSLQAHGKKWYKFLISDYKRARNHLASLCQTSLPKAPSTRIKYIEDILEAQHFKQIIAEKEQLANELFGDRWQNLQTETLPLQEIARFLHDVHRNIQQRRCPESLLAYLSSNEDPAIAVQYRNSLLSALENHQKCVEEALSALNFD